MIQSFTVKSADFSFCFLVLLGIWPVEVALQGLTARASTLATLILSLQSGAMLTHSEDEAPK